MPRWVRVNGDRGRESRPTTRPTTTRSRAETWMVISARVRAFTLVPRLPVNESEASRLVSRLRQTSRRTSTRVVLSWTPVRLFSAGMHDTDRPLDSRHAHPNASLEPEIRVTLTKHQSGPRGRVSVYHDTSPGIQTGVPVSGHESVRTRLVFGKRDTRPRIVDSRTDDVNASSCVRDSCRPTKTRV